MTPDADALRFFLLGPVRVSRGADEVALGPRQQRLVLALLLTRAGDLVTMTELIEMLWPRDAPPSAANAVHRQIGTLRRLLEPGLPARDNGAYLHRQTGGYQLHVTADTFDLLAFRRAAARARAALDAGDSGEALRLSLEALREWRGRCAAGLEPVSLEHPAFAAIEAEHLQAVRTAADAAAAGGDTGAALVPLRQAADRHPLDEGLQSRLLVALAASGRQAEAVDRYREIRGRLAEELGVDPGEELREAYDRLLHQRVRPAVAPVPQVVAEIRPAQLPPALPFFTGRAELLAEAREIAERPAGGVLAIDGMPGVGKTTMSVHLAHAVAGHYPDGQLYVDLRGFDGHGPAMTPSEALRGFLGSLGVPQDRVPAELHAQAGMYRSTVAGRRLLIVLDNCRDAEQVRHLLPGTPGCLVIANSRSRLTGLLTGFGAHPIRLGPPTVAEAREGVRQRLGVRADREPHAVAAIIAACGRLPLALAVVCAQAAGRPGTPLADIAAELAAGSVEEDLRPVFFWSYRALSAPAARLFRLLTRHPGPDFSTAAAAALAGVTPREGRALVGELDRAQLVIEHRPGRFRTHELLRAYASDLSRTLDRPDVQEEAVDRLATFYRDTVLTGHRVLRGRKRKPRPLMPHPLPEPGPTPLDGAGPDAALDWFDAERDVLMTLVGQAATDDRYGSAWLLVLGIQSYWQRSGRALDWSTVARVALDAAIRAGDTRGQARMHRSLAAASYFLGEFDNALRHLDRARELLARTGPAAELAWAGINQGMVLTACGRNEEALALLEVATKQAEATGDRLQLADCLSTRAESCVALGRLDEALDLAERARFHLAANDDDYGLGDVWTVVGRVHAARGSDGEAVRAWREAVASYRKASVPTLTAEVLTLIGDTLTAAGDRTGAQEAWREALDLTSQAQTASVQALRDRLHHLAA
ncbi:BTAD domain-containing putative transcriptional regulator [Actinoplanes sp. NBRC 103695]|uniref:AfsR/SARP family transcriptional regulator n=1 Tax=Actinoplanes sp. NBRC 103695 TaxID=3032202 RepID=UPI0024A5DE63|nr:BTAD domain-containing putative transcriptional regulator [Actinoplanes sp. NBRC 103695]GLY95330.1 SARP family transcriptional regulator [Actinoplanes sp. NBRC 103695]